jgi:hypothetical protein
LARKSLPGSSRNPLQSLADAEREFLRRATDFFGTERQLEGIRVSDVRAWAAELLTTKGSTGHTLGPESVRRQV